MNSSIKHIFSLALCLWAILPNAFAYLDPGSGSYILQMIVAGALGGLYAIKLYWYRIVSFFKGGSSKKSDDMIQEVEDEK
ncbi:MAG: hypothetical protein ACI8ZN_000275 [Bacteroidia bacterium]|jgi:hypothetical protein